MSDQLILKFLTEFIATALKHQHIERLIRENWRYTHIQQSYVQEARPLLRTTDRLASELRQACADLAEPTYFSRLARQLTELWDNYRNNTGLYLAERIAPNRERMQKSRETFESELRTIDEGLKKLNNQ